MEKLGQKVPYFFPVSLIKWRECLFEDKLDNEKMFSSQETFVAVEKEQIIGFIQYGQPASAWDEKGSKYRNPQIGIIRHFYFDEGRFDAAATLCAKSEDYMGQFPNQHAFYHSFGMSCNAHHGKLHQTLAHIDRFLCEHGYQIEHENLYYSLVLAGKESYPQNELRLVPKPKLKPDLQEYEICLQENPMGMIQIQFLEDLTGGVTSDTVYLTWMAIHKALRRQGWGTKAMQMLVTDLLNRGYQHLHLDTSSTNEVAQQFYNQYGFQNRGLTRCYLKATR